MKLVPVATVEVQEEARERAEVIHPAEREWTVGDYCYHRDINVHGHCRQCGECRDHAACAITLEILNKGPDHQYGGVVSWFNRHNRTIVKALLWMGALQYTLRVLSR